MNGDHVVSVRGRPTIAPRGTFDAPRDKMLSLLLTLSLSLHSRQSSSICWRAKVMRLNSLLFLITFALDSHFGTEILESDSVERERRMDVGIQEVGAVLHYGERASD